jgi:hypothetical protein
MTVQLIQGPGASQGDTPMMGRKFYYPSLPRLLLENLTITRGQVQKSVGKAEVERRLIETCEARGEEALNQLRDQARVLAPGLGLPREQALLDKLIGTILGTRNADMQTAADKGLAAAPPYYANRLALLEKLATHLRATPLKQPAAVTTTDQARMHFAFLESYFSNFIEGTEFDVQDARGFVLQGRPITTRPQDSHDVLGVFRQAVNPGWANQTLGVGEPVLHQLRDRHRDQLAERPEVGPGTSRRKPTAPATPSSWRLDWCAAPLWKARNCCPPYPPAWPAHCWPSSSSQKCIRSPMAMDDWHGS